MLSNAEKRIVFILCCVCAGLVLLWALTRRAEDLQNKPSSYAPSIRGDGRQFSIIEQWTSAARDCNVPTPTVDEITLLIEQALGRQGLPPSATIDIDFRQSLSNFLRVNGTRYPNTVPWLIEEAVKRKKAPPYVLKQARKEFNQYLDTVGNRIRSDFQELLGEEFPKFERQIDKGITWTKQTTKEWFELLQADPLFPIFKGPLNKKAVDKAVELALSKKEYTRYIGPMKMMESKDKSYAEWLERGFFRYLPTYILCYATFEEVQPEFYRDRNSYWANMNIIMVGVAGLPSDNVWPVTIGIKPSTNRLNNSLKMDRNSRTKQQPLNQEDK
jgi:hypothetical protein